MRGGLTWTPSTAQPPRACRLLGSEPSFQRHANRRLEVPGWAGKALSAVLIRIPATGSGESAQSCPIRSLELGLSARVAWSWNPPLAPKPRRGSPVTGAWPLFQSESRLLGPVRPRGFPRKSLRGSRCWPRESLFSPGSHPLKKKKMPAFNRLFPLASLLLILWGKYQHPAMRGADNSNNVNNNNTLISLVTTRSPGWLPSVHVCQTWDAEEFHES